MYLVNCLIKSDLGEFSYIHIVKWGIVFKYHKVLVIGKFIGEVRVFRGLCFYCMCDSSKGEMYVCRISACTVIILCHYCANRVSSPYTGHIPYSGQFRSTNIQYLLPQDDKNFAEMTLK